MNSDLASPSSAAASPAASGHGLFSGIGTQLARRAADPLFRLECATVLALVLPLVLLAAVVLHTRHLALAQNRAMVERLARTAHEHSLKVFETSDVLMGRIEDLVQGLTNQRIRERSDDLYHAMGEMADGLAHVHAVWLTDENGRVLASSRSPFPNVDVSARPSFQRHRANPDRLQFAAPRTSDNGGHVYFEASRKRLSADGRFTGLLVVALSPRYFRDFYAEVSPESTGVTHTLLESGGAVLARWPANLAPGDTLSPASPIRAAMAAAQRSGSLHSVSTVDGRARIAAYRQVNRYPVYVHAGIDEDVALAAWREDALVLAAFVLPLAMVLALATFAALRRTRENVAMAQRLQEESIERSKVEAALHHSQKLEALGHLTGGVAHDFNNLLMVVSMNASVLEKQVGAGTPARPLQAIHSAVRAGSKLTRQLVGFTRRQPLVPQPIDFAGRLEADVELLRTLLGTRVQLEAHVAPGTPAVLLDPSELELALINLAINAKHAMPEGGKVGVDVRRIDDGEHAGCVALTFSDTGTGIAPADLERVFEPFFTTKAVGSGTGLGLSQVQGLCVRAGGSVSIRSTPGAGTSVRLVFPALAAPAQAAAESTAPGDAERELDADILLVEDNLEVASATVGLLRSAGARVTYCEDAAAALALPDDETFDVVLSDIVMPGDMDGIEFARVLRQRRPGLPVLLMTGYAQRIPEAERLGVAVLPKPVEPGVLLARLRGMLQARRVKGAA